MYLNTLSPQIKSKKLKKRLGRGIGSGTGKTSGRGHKGQNARSGGGVRRGFEGGQTPIYRRIPKSGFVYSKTTKSKKIAEICLHNLIKIKHKVISVDLLKKINFISNKIKSAKIIMSNKKVNFPLNIKGIKVSKKARIAIESAGGKIEE